MNKHNIVALIINFNDVLRTIELVKFLTKLKIIQRVVVISNGSQTIPSCYSDIMTEIITVNTGFGNAYNEAFSSTLTQFKFDTYLLINTDVTISENTILTCLKTLHSKPDYGICSCIMKNYDLTSDLSYWKHSTYIDYIKCCFYYSQSKLIKRRIKESNKSNLKEPTKIDIVRESFMILKREIIPKSGKLFDKDIFMYNEGECLYHILKSKGYSMCIQPRCYYIHNHVYSKYSLSWYEFIKSSVVIIEKYLKKNHIQIILFYTLAFLGLLERRIIGIIVHLKRLFTK